MNVKNLVKPVIGAAVLATSGAVMAEPIAIDFTPLTDSIDILVVIGALLAAAGIGLALTMTRKGAETVSQTIKKS